MAQIEEDVQTPEETNRETRIRSVGLDPRVLQKAADGDVLAIMSLGVNIFELSTDAIPNTDAMQFIAEAMNTAYQKNMTGEISLPDHSLETIDLSLETISYEHPHIVAGMGKIPPEVTSQPIEQPSTPTTALTRAEIIEKMREIQKIEQTVPLETFEQGFVFLNPAYSDFFAAVKDTGGVFVNSLADQLETALNDDPETLQTLIDLSDNTSSIDVLTETIQTEAGATDLVYALAQANGQAPYSINPHEATPLPSVGPDIPTISEIITEHGGDPLPDQSPQPLGTGDDHPIQMTAPSPLTLPPAPESIPSVNTAPPAPPAQPAQVARAEETPILSEATPETTTLAVAETGLDMTSEFNYVTHVSDANILLDGIGANDKDYLRDLVEEAREMGVDPELITSLEAELDTKDFVTTKASVAGVTSYAQALKDALEGDGLISRDEYRQALTCLFNETSDGMVIDRKGIADDIAAAPGTKAIAQQLMDEASELAERSAPQAERVMAEAREAAERISPATATLKM